MCREEPLVCVKCGWGWPSAANRCVNRDCKGFCTWGAAKGDPPTSWLPDRPRPVGMPDEEWRAAWRAVGR